MSQPNLAIKPDQLTAIYRRMALSRAVDKAVQTGLSAERFYLLETDKTAREIKAPVAGRLLHKAAPGEVYAIGTKTGEID